MPTIDQKTLFLDFTLTASISLIFIFLLWHQNKNRYKGLHLLVACYAFNLVNIILILLRGHISAFSSIVLSNTISMIGVFCGLLGLEMFVGLRSKHYISYLYFPIFVAIQAYFTWIIPDMAIRNVNIAFGFMFFSFQSAWLLLYRTPKHLRKLTRETGFIYLIFFCINLARFFEQISVARNNSLNHLVLSNFDLYILLLYQISLLIMSFFIIHMINKRLKNDILQEEKKLLIAYHAVPYAILITRKHDGLIIDVNEGFEQITGYSRDEVIGKTKEEIKLWVDAVERDVLLSMLQKNNEVNDLEFQFRVSSGGVYTGQISCINITVDETECLLSVVNDVTEKKKAERELKLSRDILKNLILDQQTEHEIEKINLATQIDNNLNQSLASLRLNLGALKKKLIKTVHTVPEEVTNLVETTYNQTGIAIERSLNLMNSMRNEVLYLFGLVEAITFSVEEIQKKGNIACTFTTGVDRVELEKNRSFALFNIFQEITNTILQKNQTTQIDIHLDVEGDMLILNITENGKCFENYFLSSEKHTQLAILKEKVALLNGVVSLCHLHNNNTLITIEMPLRF